MMCYKGLLDVEHNHLAMLRYDAASATFYILMNM